MFVSLNTEFEPNTTEYLTAELPGGDYSLQLQPGWYVEQWDPFTDTTIPVPAWLISQNPVDATVTELSTTIVTYTFYVDGVGAINLGNGDLAVNVDFETEPQACDPNAADCPDGLSCYLTDLPTTEFECMPDGFVPAYQECFTPFDCQIDHACVPVSDNFHCTIGVDCCVPTCDVVAPACPNGESCIPLLGDTGYCSTN